MAHDEGQYFRVPVDARSMEYELYFSEGDSTRAPAQEYTSANTTQLDLDATMELLLTLPQMRALAVQAGTIDPAPQEQR